MAMNLLTGKQIAEKLSCSKAYIYVLLKKDPTFPRPMTIGLGMDSPRGVRWVEEEITQWLLTRKNIEVNPNEDGRFSEDLHPSEGEEVPA
jgi:predicted DNA-binding transcriptional regulator AlpA